MKRKRIRLAAIVWALMLLGSKCWGLENQIINSEFDAGIEPWQRSDGDGYTIDVVQAAGLSGLNALKIDISDVNAQESIMITQGIFALEQGATYHIGFTAKAEADRQIGLLLEYNNVWAYTWHKWIDLTTSPQTFTFEFINSHNSTDTIVLYFILNHPWFPLHNEDENIDVYIDSVYIVQEPLADPNLAHYPWPHDGAKHEETWICCSWALGQYASTHDVYFSDNFDDVFNGNEDTYRGNYRDTFFIYGFLDYPHSPGLIPGNTYYWRIDEVNDMHPDSPWKGDVWSFWIPPRTAYAPYPSDGTELIDPNVTLSWKASSYANTYNVYFGENVADVENGIGGTFKGNFSTTSYLPDCLDFETTYYWRVDVVYSWGAYEKGELWSFSTKPAGLNTAYNPYPADGTELSDPNITLSWEAGFGAKLHVLYFGENSAEVEAGTGGTFKCIFSKTSYLPDHLENGKTYFWRVDEFDVTTTHKGEIWSFTTVSDKVDKVLKIKSD